MCFGGSHFILEVRLEVKSEVAVGHDGHVHGVFALLFLAVGGLEGLGELVEVEELVVDYDQGGDAVTDYEVPAFLLEEGVAHSTAKAAQSVGLDADLDLEVVAGADNGFVLDLKLAVDLELGEVVEALLDVEGAVAVEEAEEVVSFLLAGDEGTEVSYFAVLAFADYLVGLLCGEVEL